MSTKNKSTSKKPQRKITEAEVELAKQILYEWGKYPGDITPEGFRALRSAIRTLEKAQQQKKAGE